MTKYAVNIHAQTFQWHLLHFSCINTLKCDSWVLQVYIYKKLPKCFPQWLCHLVVPPAVFETSSCFITSPKLGIDSLILALGLGLQCYFIVVLIFTSQVINDTEHLFTCLPVICISSLVRYLSNFCPFFIEMLCQKFLYVFEIQILCPKVYILIFLAYIFRSVVIQDFCTPFISGEWVNV